MAEMLPALSLDILQRKDMPELADEIERLGFAALYVRSPSGFGNIAACAAIAHATRQIVFGTAVSSIYASTATEFAQSAGLIHRLSGGRFRFGIGVTGVPLYESQKGVVTPMVGEPLADARKFIADYRYHDPVGAGLVPPIVIDAVCRSMIALAGEIADGVIFTNCCRSQMTNLLTALPPAKRKDPNFLIAALIPTIISDDLDAAYFRLRSYLAGYTGRSAYRNHCKEAGYVEEMVEAEKLRTDLYPEAIPWHLPPRFVNDVALYGSPRQVRDGIAAWRDAGITTPVLVPYSLHSGDKRVVVQEIFDAFAA